MECGHGTVADVSLEHLVFPTLVFLLAGFVKGVIGLGLPAVSVGLLGLMTPPAQSASLLVVPSTVTNVWQLAIGPGVRPLLRRLWPMFAGIVVGVWLGSGRLAADTGGRGRVWLGAVLALYGVFGLVARPLRVAPERERFLSPLVGLATGLATSATGVFTLPMVPYLSGLGLPRAHLVQALGLSFTVCTLALAADLSRSGAFDASVLGRSALAVVPALLGMFVGQAVRSRISAAWFQRCFFVGMVVLGLQLVLG